MKRNYFYSTTIMTLLTVGYCGGHIAPAITAASENVPVHLAAPDNLQDLPSYDSTTTRTGTSPLFVSVNPVYAANGNVLRVDARFGNDSYGARNGLPFLTIGAAITASRPGDVIRVFPGTYNETLTITDGVTVSGVSQSAVIISKFVSTATDTDLVTMGATGVLENVTLSLTSNQHATFNGINYTAVPAVTSLNNVSLTVDNSAASIGGTSTVRGILQNADSVLMPNVIAMQNCKVTVVSNGLGGKRGINNSGNPGTFNLNNCVITATGGTANDTIGFRTTNAGSISVLTNCTLSGSTADIAQGLGSITLNSCTLVNSTANSLGFSTGTTPAMLEWGATNNIGAGTTYMRPGFAGADGTEIQTQVTRACIAKNLSLVATAGPTTDADTWTLFASLTGGTSTFTSLTATLLPAATTTSNTGVSVRLATGTLVSMRQVKGTNGTGTINPIVTVELY